jgi:hypothetical protein
MRLRGVSNLLAYSRRRTTTLNLFQKLSAANTESTSTLWPHLAASVSTARSSSALVVAVLTVSKSSPYCSAVSRG